MEIVILIFSSFTFGWTIYNLPALLIGVRLIRRRNDAKKSGEFTDHGGLPFFSLIVPMKDEGKVAYRILDALMKINYPSDKYEIIVVDDASVDETSDVCRKFERLYPTKMRYFRRDISPGKPSALNYGLKFARGEIVGVFDADNLPDPGILLKSAKHFRSQNVVAVQGLLSSINAEENMLTKLIHFEGIIYNHALFLGKDKLGLFVPLTGSCQFVRRKVLEEVDGWSDRALSEDMELSARLTEKGYCVNFAEDVQSWQENPSNFGQLLRQRVRWFRGCMEVAFKYGRLLKRLDRRSVDAEVFFTGSFMMLFVLAMYVSSLYMTLAPFNLGTYTNALAQFTSLSTLFTLLTLGIGLAYATKPRRISNVKWLPFIYLYWVTQVFVAFYAFLQIVLRRPRRWTKTPRSGIISNYQLTQFTPSSSDSEHSTNL